MRLCSFLCLLPLAAVGCAEKEADNPGDILRSEMTSIEPTRPHARAEMFSHAEPQTVRAGCDARGNLHLTTPTGSRVVRPDDATFESEAIVELPQPQRGQPIRVTKSLGFIGDGKLGEARIPHADQPLTGPQAYGTRPYVPPTFYPRGY